MSHWATFKQTATNLWVTLRHDILALAVFLNGLLIFKTIYGMSVNLLDIFHIKAFSELDLSLLANAPLFMLGVFLVLNSIGLLFRAKLAWAISIILLLIALIYTLHFYPWLKFSIGFCIFTLVFLLILRKDFSHSSAAAGTIFAHAVDARVNELEELLPLLMKDKLLAKGVSHLLSSQLTRILRTHAAMSVLGHGLLRGAGLGGPVGAALNGVKAVSGSAYRVTIPAVLQIACLRRMVSATQV